MKPISEMTFEELIQFVIDLKDDINISEKMLTTAREELFKRFDKEVGDGPLFTVTYPSELETKEDIEAYFYYRNPGASIHKIEEKHNTVYGFYPAEYQKASLQIDDLGKVERRISSPSPKVNLDTLKTLFPDFYSKVTRQEDVFDDDKFGAILADDPGSLPENFERCIEGAKPKISLHMTDLRK